jgi:hypothetical protein
MPQPSNYFQDKRVSNLDNTSPTNEDEELPSFLSPDAQTRDIIVAQRKRTLLPKYYNLNSYDIVCGQSKSAVWHCGNRRFRVTISIFLQEYMEKPNRMDRNLLFIRILDIIRSSGGHFLKYSHGQWCAIGDSDARHKVGHALRDAAAFKDIAKPPKTQTGCDFGKLDHDNQKRPHYADLEEKTRNFLVIPEQYETVDCVGSTSMDMKATSSLSEPHQDAEPRDYLLDEQRIMNGSLYQQFDVPIMILDRNHSKQPAVPTAPSKTLNKNFLKGIQVATTHKEVLERSSYTQSKALLAANDTEEDQSMPFMSAQDWQYLLDALDCFP